DAAIPRCLVPALCHSIIADDSGNAQAIVAEDSLTACRLRRAMPGVAPPLRDSSLVAPEGHRKQLVGTSKTLEPFNRDKSVHILQLNTQTRGVIQVVVLAAAGGPDLEDDGDHGDGPNWDSRRRQRIRNDRIVGYCFERVAYGPATI